jgi:GH35 family endo-1,4-beta-xylanase
MIRTEESLLLPQAIRYDKDRVQTSPDDKFSEICAKISDMQEELGRSIVKLKTKQMNAERMIMGLDNTDEREVMRWYYMTVEDGKTLTWEEVAAHMNFDKRHVLRLHGNALIHISEIKGGK